jgi:hypothetical protein
MMLRPGERRVEHRRGPQDGVRLGARADPCRADRNDRDPDQGRLGRRDAQDRRSLPRGQSAVLVRVRADGDLRAAILETSDNAWVPALDQDGSERKNGEVVEVTEHLDRSTWPARTPLIVPRERPHPGPQPSFTDDDGYRVQPIRTSRSSSAATATASAPASSTASVTTWTPACPSSRSRRSRSARCGSRS